MQWVAEPPPDSRPPVLPRYRARYSGPPRYRALPRWGFPARPWVPPSSGEPAAPEPLQGARSLLAGIVPLLWATAAVALLAGAAEIWRYALLVASREGALRAGVVAASDALVVAAGTVAPILAAVAGGLTVVWTLRASRAAADRGGVEPSRGPRAIVLGWLVPGLNLSVPGSVLAEIEHTALDRPAGERPRPSRLLLVWWALWVAGALLAATVLLWSMREGVQARADGVLLHALLDLVAAATAVATAVLITRLTHLLGPARLRPRRLVVRVGTPRERHFRSTGSSESAVRTGRGSGPGVVTPSPTAPAARA